MTRRSQPPYPPELRERAVRMVAEDAGLRLAVGGDERGRREARGGTGETVHLWVRQAEVDGGVRPGRTTEESEELRRPRRKNAELTRANETSHAA